MSSLNIFLLQNNGSISWRLQSLVFSFVAHLKMLLRDVFKEKIELKIIDLLEIFCSDSKNDDNNIDLRW
uniref:Uncharacterized protein n=1 Tax=Romanomermis culicivorax TaxID=13658 RepID=A0A915K6K5_ROMCU